MGKISGVPSPAGERKGSIFRAVIELARLHQPLLTFLAWYPIVWTISLAIHINGEPIKASEFFMMLLKHYIIVASTHSWCCTLNDIFDRKFDALVPRTASRPLPSKRITLQLALIAWVCWGILTVFLVCILQGPEYIRLWLPAWILSSLYPLSKRFVSFPQLVLATATSCVIFPAWGIADGGIEGREEMIPIVGLVLAWIIYIDMFYASMDSAHDAAAGVKSLAVSLKPKIHFYLSILAALQLLCLTIISWRTGKSSIFGILGIGVWAVNNVWHIRDLRIEDGNWAMGSGGDIFQRNIYLGAWLCAVDVLDLWADGYLRF